MALTVSDLIEALEFYPADAIVRFASQPSYPFEYSIDREVTPNDDGTVVYLAEANQIGYLPGDVREAMGW